ncbi:MAG: DEAD/DEAH box helicase [Opitutales bacterium]|nr:DEAD/DEAH box helicase [Opitutales bacterium]
MFEPYIPPPKKSFSLKALALWGERLASPPVSNWENRFTEDAIYAGRRLYRESKIAEIIIGLDDATVIFRVASAGTPFLQILFDFDADGNVLWRSSSSAPRKESAPYAVAGLYVIEEFVATEYPNLPLSADGEKSETNENAQLKEASVPPPALPTRPDRKLLLKFSSAENELSFSANWIEEKSERKTSALAAEQKTLTAGEREQLIRLVAAARKSGFVFNAGRDAYVLAGTLQATRFVNEFFPAWQKRFEIESGNELAAFSKSVREIDARLFLRAESGNAFGLEWNFSLDGNAFTQSEIRTLLKHRGESVFLPGRGIVRLRSGTRAVANDWPDTETHGIPVYTLLSLFRNGENDTLVPDAKLRSWRKNFLKEPVPPKDLPEFLRPYQMRGVAWIRQMFLRGAHPLLADEMGLGKTLQTLALLSLDTTPRRPALIVCPASVIPVWKNEIQKFFPQLGVCVLGTDGTFKRRKTANCAGTPPHIWLSSYGMLRIHAELLPKKRFSCAVLDEAQYIKNPQAKMTHACLKIVADRRLALTGTPIENRHLDLWTVFRFLMPGLLGRRATLETELAEADDAVVEKLKTQIAPFILRRTKQEVARELPEKVQTVLHCPLTPQQKEHYEQIVRNGLSGNEAQESVSRLLSANPTNLLTLLMRLRQAACDPALLPGQSALPAEFSGKISVLLERLEEIIDNGGKVVVFSQFVSLLDRARSAIEQRFAGTPVFTLTGKTLDRATPVNDFQTREGAAIFLVSLRAGGTGLTLHSAEYVFLLDPWWNPAVEEQAIDRVHRIGQTRRVFVYRMVAAGTIEERIEKLKQSKRAMFDTLVGALPDMSDWASHYPSLESLIALSE